MRRRAWGPQISISACQMSSGEVLHLRDAAQTETCDPNFMFWVQRCGKLDMSTRSIHSEHGTLAIRGLAMCKQERAKHETLSALGWCDLAQQIHVSTAAFCKAESRMGLESSVVCSSCAILGWQEGAFLSTDMLSERSVSAGEAFGGRGGMELVWSSLASSVWLLNYVHLGFV